MTVQEIPHGSALYQQSLTLRDLHLRKPLGLQLTDEDTRGEDHQRHFALIDEGTIIGGLIASPGDHLSIRFRQMWGDPSLHSRGHGRQLLASVESIFVNEGFTSFTLHARKSARGFYLKCGYHEIGEPFLEIGIPHLRMKKSVA